MGGEYSKDADNPKSIRLKLNFVRRNNRYYLTEHDPGNEFESKRALWLLGIAEGMMVGKLEKIIETWEYVPPPPDGPEDHPITLKINKYTERKRQLCAQLIEECIALVFTGTTLDMQKAYGDTYVQLRRLRASVYPNGMGYYWDGSNYHCRKSIAVMIDELFRKYFHYDTIVLVSPKSQLYKPYKNPLVKNHHIRRPMVRERRAAPEKRQ